MRRSSLVHAAVVALGAAALGACGGGDPGTGPGGACAPATYPCGPYGYAEGSTIAALSLSGKRDANGSGSPVDDAVAPIHFTDYFADPALRAILVVIGAETCIPCQNEQPLLIDLHARYRAAGSVAILEAIVEGQAGKPATTTTIDAWATRYMVPFAITADPEGALRDYYNASAFPSALVIEKKTMRIVSLIGGPVEGVEATLDALVSAP